MTISRALYFSTPCILYKHVCCNQNVVNQRINRSTPFEIESNIFLDVICSHNYGREMYEINIICLLFTFIHGLDWYMFIHVGVPVSYLNHLSMDNIIPYWLISGTLSGVSQEMLVALKTMRRLRRISVVNESNLDQSGSV